MKEGCLARSFHQATRIRAYSGEPDRGPSMVRTTRLTLGAAAVLLLGAVWWIVRRDDPAPVQTAPRPDATAAAPEGRSTSVPARREPEAPDRVALPGVVADDGALSHPFGYELEVQVLDELGLPVRRARVLLAPERCRLGEVAERTGDDGVVRIVWRGRTAAMRMVVATTSDVTGEAMRVVPVESGRTARVVFGGRARQGPTLRLVGNRVRGSQVINLTFENVEPALGQALTFAVQGIVLHRGLFADNPDVRDGLHPFARFGDVQWAERADEATVRSTINSRAFNVQWGSMDVQVVGSREGAPPPARLEGTVYGEDGRPCAGCPVSWGKEVDRPRGRTKTDANGAFRFDGVPEGALELRAGGGDDGLCRATVHTMHGQTTTADPQLRRESTVRGSVHAADGAPLSGWRVEWVGVQVPWFDSCEVADDGAFVLPNLPGGPGDLLLWRNDSSSLPVMRVENVRPDVGEVGLRVDPAECAGVLRIEPLLPDGVDEAGVEVRVVQEETGRGSTLKKEEKTNQFSIRGLPAGWYRLELGGPGLGWLDAGRHFVDGRGLFDLGRVAFPATGTLRLVLPEGVEVKAPSEEGGFALEVYRRRDDCDVRIEHVAEASSDPLPLPPGDYFALWRASSGATGVEPFAVQSGVEVTVRCGRARSPAHVGEER